MNTHQTALVDSFSRVSEEEKLDILARLEEDLDSEVVTCLFLSVIADKTQSFDVRMEGLEALSVADYSSPDQRRQVAVKIADFLSRSEWDSSKGDYEEFLIVNKATMVCSSYADSKKIMATLSAIAENRRADQDLRINAMDSMSSADELKSLARHSIEGLVKDPDIGTYAKGYAKDMS